MDLKFNTSLAKGYKAKSQITRVLTEDWVARNMFCPICGEISIRHAEANAPVKDFLCDKCKAQYELKSQESSKPHFDTNVNDGQYDQMINRITSMDNPSFFFMHYDRYEVNNLIIVPKCFFTPSIIGKRKPLSPNAKRANWVGCNILMKSIPSTAKIPIITEGNVRPVYDVVAQYKKVYDLQTKSVESRGWLIDILNLVERLDKTFTLNQMYAFCGELKIKHPNNNHIQDKIRQQLQFLRDKGFIEFVSPGHYRKYDI